MTEVFNEQTLNFTDSGGVYLATVSMFGLNAGQEYTVIFDGTEHRKTAVEMVQSGVHYIVLGNPNLVWLGNDNGDPFAVADAVELGTGYVSTKNAPTTHTVAIYQGNEGGDPRNGIEIFREQEIVGLMADGLIIQPHLFELNEGETYRVVWNGVSYECVCHTQFELFPGIPVVGDIRIEEEKATTPFLLTYLSEETAAAMGESGSATFLLGVILTDDGGWSLDTAETHTLAVYQITEDEGSEDPDAPAEPEQPTEPEQPEGIVLKDRNGNDVAYYGIETVTFDTTTDGKQQVYTKGVAVEGLEIVPDFSGGDMPIMAAVNTLLRSAIIKKPEDCAPENIRKGKRIGGMDGNFIGDTEEITVDLNMANGDQVITPTADGKVISKVTVRKPDALSDKNIAADVDIGGVIGKLVAGLNVKIATGTHSYGPKTVTHNLGVVPDIFMMIRNTSGKISVIQRAPFMFGVSKAFSSKYPDIPTNVFCHYESGITWTVYNFCIDESSGNIGLQNATETSITCWSAMQDSVWIAIGGLTET